MFAERIKNRLLNQHNAGLYRKPVEINKRQEKYFFIGNRKVLNFASNDYLGLGVSDKLKRKVSGNFLKYATSSSSSRLVSGNYSVINQAEKEYARFFGYEDALFFPSGYQANIGIVSALFEKGDLLIFDKHIHASSVKGMLLSGADFHGYNHNSMSHLCKWLEKTSKNKPAVLTESLFSMDGDFLDVQGFKALKERFDFFSIVDEAHAFGATGENGKGIARDVADIGVGTFGKALGLFGAFVLMPADFKEYFFNFSSPLIYTTSLPEAHAASAIDLLGIISQCEKQRKHLREISSLTKEKLVYEGFCVKGDAHILAVEIGDENRALEISERLLEENIFVLPARYPTVPLHKAMLRIGMTALHTEKDVRKLVSSLKEAYGKIEKKDR
ncbi:MAG: pyridoxal phosphate-dependent aminotransferase family protein [Deltaproteobacteria bacterium]|nr:pyridoxal phosphate-dependent aminotransferase family protein [Deltaproteobacteria bacterium]MBW2165263.1 pyridoxal phosphate-dependent aminotransferase family protein [Deltaproteobacteria bacterium]